MKCENRLGLAMEFPGRKAIAKAKPERVITVTNFQGDS
jgi:hypothetical protein